MRTFLTHMLVLAVALGVTAWVLPGVVIDSVPALLVGALVLGFLNAVVKPVLVILTLPITVITLGIFYFLINALLFALAARLVPGFEVAGPGWAILGALILSLFSAFLGSLMKDEPRVRRLR